MRAALEGIIEALVPVRRQIEQAWHQMDRPTLPPEDDDRTEESNDEEE